MNQDELNSLLQGDELLKTLDVKTLVLDLVKEMPEEEILTIFWSKFDGLSVDYVKDYLYMRRS